MFYSKKYLYSNHDNTELRKDQPYYYINTIGNVIVLMYFFEVFLIVFTHYICIRNAYLIITFPFNETIFNGHKLMLWSLMNYVHENTFNDK